MPDLQSSKRDLSAIQAAIESSFRQMRDPVSSTMELIDTMDGPTQEQALSEQSAGPDIGGVVQPIINVLSASPYSLYKRYAKEYLGHEPLDIGEKLTEVSEAINPATVTWYMNQFTKDPTEPSNLIELIGGPPEVYKKRGRELSAEHFGTEGKWMQFALDALKFPTVDAAAFAGHIADASAEMANNHNTVPMETLVSGIAQDLWKARLVTETVQYQWARKNFSWNPLCRKAFEVIEYVSEHGPFSVTEKEQQEMEIERQQNPFWNSVGRGVVLTSIVRGGVKKTGKLKEKLGEGKEIPGDSQAQEGVLRGERKGKEPGRPVQEPSGGTEAAETGGILQTPEEVGKPGLVATAEVTPNAVRYLEQQIDWHGQDFMSVRRGYLGRNTPDSAPLEQLIRYYDHLKDRLPQQPLQPKMTAPFEFIGLNVDQNANIRKYLGLDQLPIPDRVRFQQSFTAAKEQGLVGDVHVLSKEILDSKRSVTAAETGAMVLRLAELHDAYHQAVKEMNRHIEKGDYSAARIARNSSEAVIGEIDLITRASSAGRRETARALAIGRQMVEPETYRLADIRLRAQANKGRSLSQKEIAKYEKLAQEHEDLQTKLKLAENEYLKTFAENERLKAEALATKEMKRVATRKRLRAKNNQIIVDATRELEKLGFRHNDVLGVAPEASYQLGRIALAHIRNGMISLDAVVQRIRADWPDFTERDIYEGMNALNPRAQKRARTETATRVAALKREAKLLTQIEDLESGVFDHPEHPKSEQLPAIAELQKRLQELRSEAYRSGRDPARLERAERTINSLHEQLTNRKRNLKKDIPQPTEQLAEMKEEIGNLRKMLRIEDELTKANETLDKIHRGEYIPVEKIKTLKPIPPELEKLQIELKQKRKQIRMAIDNAKPLTAGKLLAEGYNTLRTLKATADMSGTLRQGLVLSMKRPRTAIDAFSRSVGAFFSEYKAENIDEAIRSADHHYVRLRSGLYLSERDAPVSLKEEMFMSRILQQGKYNPFKHVTAASERHMVTYLNLMRAAAFDEFLNKYPNATHTELTAWADFVNNASGRGYIGRAAAAQHIWSTLFFAPRFSWSRVYTPWTLKKYWKMPRVRKEIAKDMATTLGVGIMTLGLAKASGADVGLDPRKSDFGKITVGRTRIDIAGGFQQPWRLLFAGAMNQIDKGAERWGWYDVNLLKREKDFDPLTQFGRSLAYKLAPGITLGREIWTGTDIFDEELTPSQIALHGITPLVIEDIADAWKDGGAWRVALVAPTAFLGVGANTYGDNRSPEVRLANRTRDIFEESKGIVKPHGGKGEFTDANIELFNALHDNDMEAAHLLIDDMSLEALDSFGRFVMRFIRVYDVKDKYQVEFLQSLDDQKFEATVKAAAEGMMVMERFVEVAKAKLQVAEGKDVSLQKYLEQMREAWITIRNRGKNGG